MLSSKNKYMNKLFLLLIFMPFLGQSQSTNTTNIDRIIAKIDNYYILDSDVQNVMLQAKDQGQKLDKCKALESLSVQKLLVAKAEIDSVIVEDKQVDDQLDARMGQMIRIYGEEKNIVEQFGKSLAALKNEVREQVKEQLTADKMQRTITENDKVTPQEVSRFFNKIPKDSIPTMPAEVEVSQIVRLGVVTKDQKEVLIKRLNDIKDQVNRGASFEELAKKYTEDQGSKSTGGDLGWAKRGQMVPEFEAAAMSLEPGEMSDVVESSYGYHLIKLYEIRGQEYHAKHILLRPDYNRLDMTKPTVYLDSLRNLILVDSLSFSKAAKLNSEDENSKDMGGAIIDDQSASMKLPLDGTMEPTLYFTVDTMKVGDITKPLPYRTPDGKTGMRILYLKEKSPAHKASLEKDYEKIQNYALSEKNARTIEKWFKEAIEEVYIKIDPAYTGCKLFEL